MPFGFWGAATEIFLQLPDEPVSLVLLLVLAGLNLALLARYHRSFARMSARQWILMAGLVAAGLVCSQLFPLAIPWGNPVLAAQPVLAAVSLLAAVPLLLAGVMLNPGAALVVGLATGLGHGFGQTHSYFDIVNYGLAAWLGGIMLGQNFAGRLCSSLRWPVVAGPSALSVVAILIAVEIFGRLLVSGGVLAALDMALYIGVVSLLPLMATGLVSGGLVSILVWFLPQLRGTRGRVPSPFGRSLQNYMTASFLFFTILLVLLSGGAVFALSTRTMSRALLEQMAFSVDATSARLPGLQGELSNTLVQYSGDERLLDDDPAERAKVMQQLGDLSPQFDQVLLIMADGQVSDSSGLIVDSASGLNVVEQAGVSAALSSGRTQFVGGDGTDSPIFTLVAPISDAGQPTAALVGRVTESGLSELLSGLSGVTSVGSGWLVDANSKVVLSGGVRGAPTSWQAPARGQQTLAAPGGSRGTAYETVSQPTGGRELVYYTPVPGNSSWMVVAAVPHSVILRQALEVIAPVAVLLVLFSILFFVNVSAFGRSVSRPIGELVIASRAIAGGGGLEKMVRVERDDELGQLSTAFGQMQRSLKQRLDELNLLLMVSNEVASSINLSQGMPAVLQGVLRGTGASAARAVVRNPSASYPLLFGEGPASETLASLDRLLMTKIRTVDEIALSSVEEIEAELQTVPNGISAVFAVPLRTASEFQGVLYLGYRQNHYFDSTERNLLRTLAGQASVLVQNAHLFTSAESGRQRLAAILASTTNAVIVTDQTDRILLTNPAMERAFRLKTLEIAGRPVQDIIRPQALADRLSLRNGRVVASLPGGVGSVEVQVNGRTFVANISNVFSGSGQALGRVAVLHDVTEFKDLDRMRSDFLAGVSHDLLSPLTYMRNYTGLMSMTDDAQLQQEYVDKILGGIDRMTHVINDLLDLARIEAGVNLELRPVPLAQLLLDVGQEHWSHARAAGITIKSQVTGTPVAQCDPVLLRRAVNNLVTNAIKYAPHSGELLLHAAAVRNEFVISVQDYGPGIPAAELPHLFESFYRGKEHLHDNTRGSGLGLAIVKSIVELHGGRVTCESEPEQGTRFVIRLPADPKLVRKQNPNLN